MADRGSPGELVVTELQASSFQKALNLHYPTRQSLFPVGVRSMTVKVSVLSILYLWHLAMSQLQILPSAMLCAAADGSEACPLSRYTEPWDV